MKTIIFERNVDWIYCDPAGIMFYPQYYIWFDQATERLFTENGLSYERAKELYNIIGYPLVESGAKYFNPCKHGEKVELHTTIKEWAGKTFVVEHKIFHKNGDLALEGFERRVWAINDPSTPKGMRAEVVPQKVQDLFAD